MTADTYRDLMAAADRAETQYGPDFARRIREHTEALAVTSLPLDTGPDAPARARAATRARQGGRGAGRARR